MPGNRRVFALAAPYIEIIHDSFVSVLWPMEPVDADEYRDRGMVESSAARPFQTFDQKPLFRTTPQKAAALFHSLIANHPFENGNKRTAVLALDLFLTANGLFLYLDNDRMYQLAKDTASYVPQGVSHDQMLARIAETVKGSIVPFAELRRSNPSLAADVRLVRRQVRRDEYNATSPLNARS